MHRGIYFVSENNYYVVMIRLLELDVFGALNNLTLHNRIFYRLIITHNIIKYCR